MKNPARPRTRSPIAKATCECEHHRLLDEAMAELAAAVGALPPRCHPYRGNALLNLALGQLVNEYGQAATARLMARVVGDLAREELPTTAETASNPFRLNG